MAIIGISQGGNLDSQFNAACTKLRSLYARLGFRLYQDTLLDEIATVDMASKQAKSQLYMAIDGSGYTVRGIGDETDYSSNPAKIIAECEYQRMDLFGIKYLELADELSKRITIESMPLLGGKPAMMPLLEILGMLESNPVCLFDNTAFFGTHAADPFDAGVGTHSNIITQPKTTAGWNAVLQQIMTRKDPGSKTATGPNPVKRVYLPNRDLNGSSMSLWTGDTGVMSDLDKIFDPRSLWVATGATETRKVYAQTSMQFVPEMSSFGSGPGGPATNFVYILIKNDTDRGVYVRIPDAARVDPVEVIPSQHTRRVKAWQTFGKTVANPYKLYIWKFS